jgi:hypothetical protein
MGKFRCTIEPKILPVARIFPAKFSCCRTSERYEAEETQVNRGGRYVPGRGPCQAASGQDRGSRGLHDGSRGNEGTAADG